MEQKNKFLLQREIKSDVMWLCAYCMRIYAYTIEVMDSILFLSYNLEFLLETLPPKSGKCSKTHIDGQGNPDSNEPISGGENKQTKDADNSHQNLDHKEQILTFGQINELNDTIQHSSFFLRNL